MSIKVMSTVWQHANVSGSELLVLLAMADYGDDNGDSIFPAMKSLGDKARLSEDQARRVVHKLIKSGLVELVAVGGWRDGRNWANEYRLCLDKIAGGTGNLQGPSTNAGTLQSARTTRRRKDSPRADATTVPAPVQDQPLLDPPLQPLWEKAAEAAPAAYQPLDQEFAAICQKWTDNMPGTLTPVITDMFKEWQATYATREILSAIDIAVKRGKRFPSYVEGILRKGGESVMTGDAFEREVTRRQDEWKQWAGAAH